MFLEVRGLFCDCSVINQWNVGRSDRSLGRSRNTKLSLLDSSALCVSTKCIATLKDRGRFGLDSPPGACWSAALRPAGRFCFQGGRRPALPHVSTAANCQQLAYLSLRKKTKNRTSAPPEAADRRTDVFICLPSLCLSLPRLLLLTYIQTRVL